MDNVFPISLHYKVTEEFLFFKQLFFLPQDLFSNEVLEASFAILHRIELFHWENPVKISGINDNLEFPIWEIWKIMNTYKLMRFVLSFLPPFCQLISSTLFSLSCWPIPFTLFSPPLYNDTLYNLCVTEFSIYKLRHYICIHEIHVQKVLVVCKSF